MSIEVVLADGTIVRTPGVPNHASGPDFMRLFLGSEGTFGVITEATMRIARLPQTRLFRALLFKDVQTGLEAGRRLMVERLDPLVIRMYDQHSTASLVKRVLGYELDGAYMIVGFDGWEEIATAQEARAMKIFEELGARDLGREPGEKWWDHRYDFYYPPYDPPAGDVRHDRDGRHVQQDREIYQRRRRRSKATSGRWACSTSAISRTGSRGARVCTIASC